MKLTNEEWATYVRKHMHTCVPSLIAMAGIALAGAIFIAKLSD